MCMHVHVDAEYSFLLVSHNVWSMNCEKTEQVAVDISYEKSCLREKCISSASSIACLIIYKEEDVDYS